MEFGLTSVASYWHLHLPQGQASAYKGSSIDHGLSADAIEASAVLQEDSRPQAILKHRPPNSLDYSTRYECQPKKSTIWDHLTKEIVTYKHDKMYWNEEGLVRISLLSFSTIAG